MPRIVNDLSTIRRRTWPIAGFVNPHQPTAFQWPAGNSYRPVASTPVAVNWNCNLREAAAIAKTEWPAHVDQGLGRMVRLLPANETRDVRGCQGGARYQPELCGRWTGCRHQWKYRQGSFASLHFQRCLLFHPTCEFLLEKKDSALPFRWGSLCTGTCSEHNWRPEFGSLRARLGAVSRYRHPTPRRRHLSRMKFSTFCRMPPQFAILRKHGHEDCALMRPRRNYFVHFAVVGSISSSGDVRWNRWP